MNKALIIAALGTAALLTAPVAAAARDLTVVSWGGAYQDAQKEIFFKPFVAQTGIPLVDDSWDGGIGVLRAKIEGGASNWDVVQVESEELELGCEENLFEKLDWSKIGGKDAYLPAAVHDCGVGAILYTFVLGYDGDKFAHGPKSWADFWDTKKFPGKRALREGPKTNLEIALIADGVKPQDVYKVLSTDQGVDRAFKKLDQIKSSLIFWKSGAQPPQLLASGEVVMTSAYNGRLTAANAKDHKNFKTVWDGGLYTLDSWVIMKGSPNKDAASKFLNFIGDPARQAQLPKYIAYGVTNRKANAMIDPALLPELPTNPENLANEVQLSASFWLENIDRLNERFNNWIAK